MITINGVTITGAQLDAIVRLMKNGWKVDLTTISKLPADTCVMVAVVGEKTGMSMFMGIEADGYTHS